MTLKMLFENTGGKYHMVDQVADARIILHPILKIHSVNA
jgi:hypothetical protein